MKKVFHWAVLILSLGAAVWAIVMLLFVEEKKKVAPNEVEALDIDHEEVKEKGPGKGPAGT